MVRSIRWFFQYLVVVVPYVLMRLLPYCGICFLARLGGWGLYHIPVHRRLIMANIRCAMPELPEPEILRIARESSYHLCMNMLEFAWVQGRPDRIERCYGPDPETHAALQKHLAAGERVLFVNPHLGSWEASGVIAPYFHHVDLVAVAKPAHNPRLNKLLNESGRQKCKGLRIIFSRGAIRGAIQALREGASIGLLVDQNTPVREGGCFINFFGVPVSSSKSPGVLKRYCDANNIPAVIVYASSLRDADGKVRARIQYLPKPFDEYEDDAAVLQAFMDMSEQGIRQNPEQYLWLYRRFRHIPPEVPEEVRARYPYYAHDTHPGFFARETRKKS